MAKTVDIYIDFKSPYAYLAVEPARHLARDYRVTLNWLPYTLNIPDFLGSARVDDRKQVIEAERSDHQWRRVKYLYMDVRRYANLRGMTVRGPQKIWDSTTAAIGLLFAKDQDRADPYIDRVYPRFWQRALDIEDREVIRACLDEAGAETGDFFAYLDGPGRDRHDRIRREAEALGVFGTPTFVVDGELFWGREHFSLIRLRLHEQGLARPEIDPPIDVTLAMR